MSATPRSAVSSALAADRLGAASVASFALTAAAPLMVVGGVVVSGWAITGVTGYPLAFVLVAAMLAVFSVGYVAMSRRISNAGAFYSYIAQGAGKPLGVGAALMALLAYNMLQIGVYGIFGASLSYYLDAKFGIGVEWWICALVAWAFVAVLGLARVDVNSKLLAVLLGAEIILVLLFDVVFVANPSAEGVTFAAFAPSNLFQASVIGAVLVTVTTAFVGFEAAPVFAEESKDARRTVPAATYAGLGVMLFLYAATAWAITVAVGNGNVVTQAQAFIQSPSDLIFTTAATHLGDYIVDVGNVLLITSAFAAMLSYHNTTARYTYALAREGVLPRGLARTGARSGAPQAASLLQTAVALVVLVAYAVLGLDPIVQLFFWLGTTGGFGILLLLALTSVAVIGYFRRNAQGESVFSRVLAPAVALIALVVVIYLALSNYSALLGVPSDDPVAWILPGLYLLFAVVGVIWALVLRSNSPAVYAKIGHGAEAATTPVSVSFDSTDAGSARHSAGAIR